MSLSRILSLLTSFTREGRFLSDVVDKFYDLVYRSHPARQNEMIVDYRGKAVSGAVGYTTNYLIETLKASIPTYTCSNPEVECLVNANLTRRSRSILVGNLKFVELAITKKILLNK